MKNKRFKPRTNPKNFVECSRLTHGDTYDYSKAVYVNSTTAVLITCRTHGDFWQNPMNHIHKGSGCVKCAHRDSPDEFFAKATKVHGEKYDYSISRYLTTESRIDIACNIHGVFSVLPKSHLDGAGCPKCREYEKFTEEDFIAKAIEIYGDRFSYNDNGFTGSQNDVTVTCKLHGRFKTRAYNFLFRNAVCEICYTQRRLTLRRFLHVSKRSHGEKYSYALADHKVSGKKLPLICREHGLFWQTPGVHMSGSGCQGCAPCGFDRSAPASLYILVAPGLVKIGITNRSPEDRAKKINLSCDHNFTAHRHWQFEVGEHAEKIEKMSLAILRQTLQSPTEMFDGYTETFLNTTTEFVEQTITKVAQSLGLAI